MEHLFNVGMAKKYGVNAAIVVRHLQFWIIKNKSNKKHLHEGRTWTYCSINAFTKIFPYWSARQLRTILDGLIESGVILKGNFNQKGYDHTTWYAFTSENPFVKSDKSICHLGQNDVSKPAKAFVRSDQPIPNPKTNKLTDKLTNQLACGSQSLNVVLELDSQIAEKSKLLTEQITLCLKPNRKELITFARIVAHLIGRCQAKQLPVSIFTDAIEWAKQASQSTAINKKGLFVAKIKQETGFKAQSNLLRKKTV